MTEYRPPNCCVNIQDGYGHHPGCRRAPGPVVLHTTVGEQAEPFVRQTLENLANELCVGAEPDQPVKSQDELLTALDELLDSSLHDDGCYIDAHDTTCRCIIGRIRAVLPPCGAAQDKGNGVFWKCHRNAHPASPDRHVF